MCRKQLCYDGMWKFITVLLFDDLYNEFVLMSGYFCKDVMQQGSG